mmetsp:Transcript_16259/g.28574  ORF Transcript_16259/g.28574 Transcript_16259/m.28574 type:complete len:262 (+) Transcript_16259:345-1130(+)
MHSSQYYYAYSTTIKDWVSKPQSVFLHRFNLLRFRSSTTSASANRPPPRGAITSKVRARSIQHKNFVMLSQLCVVRRIYLHVGQQAPAGARRAVERDRERPVPLQQEPHQVQVRGVEVGPQEALLDLNLVQEPRQRPRPRQVGVVRRPPRQGGGHVGVVARRLVDDVQLCLGGNLQNLLPEFYLQGGVVQPSCQNIKHGFRKHPPCSEERPTRGLVVLRRPRSHVGEHLLELPHVSFTKIIVTFGAFAFSYALTQEVNTIF